MIDTRDILDIRSPEGFESAAIEIFRRQAGVGGRKGVCEPYREYLDAAGIEPESVGRVEDIPFLPIELFKTRRVYSGAEEPEALFTSSSTGGAGEAKHYVASMADYARVYERGFELFYGDPARWSIYALLPSYLEREGSSLVRMADGLIRHGLDVGRGGGFYLYDHEKLLHELAVDSGPKMLLGVSYALLDLAETVAARGEKLPAGTVVVETGGMKGRREEMPKERMHSLLGEAFGVNGIHSEYGMAELMSQAWSHGSGIFRTPPWMRIAVRDLRDPFDVRFAAWNEPEKSGGPVSAWRSAAETTEQGGPGTVDRGGIDIIDLANVNSCAFIQTQDVGTLFADGSFTVEGRAARSDVRGCNLLVQ